MIVYTMFIKYKNNPILVPDAGLSYERESTYNPCAVVKNRKIFLIYRAENEYGNYISSLCLATSTDGYHFKKYRNNPIIKPTRPEEKIGCEDSRITKIDDTYYLTYTAYQHYREKTGHKIALSLATSKNLIGWKKLGVILQDNKAGHIYHQKLNGQYLMFFGEGVIRTAWSKNLKEWEVDAKPLLIPRKNKFDSHLVEVGPPPIVVDDKLFFIYNSADKLKRYLPSFIVLDKKNQTKILGRSNKPLLNFTEHFEKLGKVNNVIFAEGLVEYKNKYFLYYGCADKCIGVATITKKDLRKLVADCLK